MKTQAARHLAYRLPLTSIISFEQGSTTFRSHAVCTSRGDTHCTSAGPELSVTSKKENLNALELRSWHQPSSIWMNIYLLSMRDHRIHPRKKKEYMLSSLHVSLHTVRYTGSCKKTYSSAFAHICLSKVAQRRKRQ